VTTYIDEIAKRIEASLDSKDRPKSNGHELYRLYALLALVKGRDVSLSDVHNAWSVWISASQPEHPALIPFEDLNEEQRMQDAPYAAAIRSAVE